MNDMTDLCLTRDVTLIAADGNTERIKTVLLSEHELDIIVNEQHVMSLVCTKQDLYELVMGRLLTGGFIDGAEDVDKILFCKEKTRARVFLKRNIDLEEALEKEETCCTGNKIRYTVRNNKNMKQLPEPLYRREWIFAMAERFEKGTALHDTTSCTHSCMLSRKGEILFECEDIGRHNAIDKAVGYGISSDIRLSECILYTSGRVPVDMAEKAIAAGIPVLASKSVPTAQAVEFAGQYGLVIIGNARPDSMKVFD